MFLQLSNVRIEQPTLDDYKLSLEKFLMRSVTYSMGVSLDGYIVRPDGDFAWTASD